MNGLPIVLSGFDESMGSIELGATKGGVRIGQVDGASVDEGSGPGTERLAVCEAIIDAEDKVEAKDGAEDTVGTEGVEAVRVLSTGSAVTCQHKHMISNALLSLLELTTTVLLDFNVTLSVFINPISPCYSPEKSSIPVDQEREVIQRICNSYYSCKVGKFEDQEEVKRRLKTKANS